MKTFLIACVAAIVIAVIGGVVLSSRRPGHSRADDGPSRPNRRAARGLDFKPLSR